jgi:hypothetical protein
VDVLLAEFDAVGLGVEDIFTAASSCDISDILSLVSFRSAVIGVRAESSNI